MKKTNYSSLTEYKHSQRNKTLQSIDEAISYLREKGLPITKVQIASEARVHRNTMNQEYVRIHLLKYPEFNLNIKEPASKIITIEEYEQQLTLLKNKLEKTKQAKERLASENVKLRFENKKLLDKYQHLLGKYQVDVGKKIIPF